MPLSTVYAKKFKKLLKNLFLDKKDEVITNLIKNYISITPSLSVESAHSTT